MTRPIPVLAVAVLMASCGAGLVGELGTDAFEVTAPLTLSGSTVESGTTLTVSMTMKNVTADTQVVTALAIEALPPGGDAESGPKDVLVPVQDQVSVAPGASVTLLASRTFTDDDSVGTWEAYASFKLGGRQHRGPPVHFEHHRRDGGVRGATDGGTTRPDAGTITPDAGIPRADAGTPRPDAGTPDAGTPRPDAGTPDAGTPRPDAGTPDAGTPRPDAGTPDAGAPDAGTPRPDAGVTPVDAGPPPPAWDGGPVVEPVSPGVSDVTFTVRADSDVHPISPLIYGSNQVQSYTTTQRGLGLMRAGGNRWTAFNWENGASNAGTDYNNQNDNYLVQSSGSQDAPGEAARLRIDPALAAGAAAMVTIPVQGYVAADKLGNGDVNQSSSYLTTRFKQNVARKGSAFSLTPDTSDAVVYQDEFVNWLKVRYPDAFSATAPRILFTLDNEPDLWSDTHPRIQAAPVTPAALIAKNIEYASAVKAVIPTATVTGFVSYGFAGFQTLQGTYTGSGDFISYYLDQMRAAEASAGTRLLDVLDLHWYPEATGDGQRIDGNSTTAGSVEARVQAPRSLWDPTYTETSWVASYVGGPIKLLPDLKARIAAHYPGTRLAFTEYSYGGATHISGAIAEADVLGIFGREGVYAATFWDLSSPSTMIYAGLRAYTSYDEAGAHFGDTSVRASTSDVVRTSVYASIDAAHPGRMVIVAINKTSGPLTAAISLAAYGTYTSAQVYRLTSAGSTWQSAGTVSATTRNGFFYAMPAYSVSVLVPQ